jgi:hypothetical protein
MKLQEFAARLDGLSAELKTFLKETHYMDKGNFSGVEYHEKDSEASFFIGMLHDTFFSFKDAALRIDYLNSPVVAEGQLFEDDNGNYALASGGSVWTFHAGAAFEALVKGWEDVPHWEIVQLEYDDKKQKFCIRHHSEIRKVEGLTVRIREQPINFNIYF